MVRCFMTGVEFPLEKGFVLNRREAYDLLNALKDRIGVLRRVIDQLSPLDDQDNGAGVSLARRSGFASKKHRLVCKAVADAIAPGFPEIELFQNWPTYRAYARQIIRRGSRSHLPERPAAPALSDHENKRQP